MIPAYVKDQIKDADLVQIIENEGIKLKREGANYKCCCPFHNEKTPSFVVSPSKNIYHCFGQCNETGDAISFIMHLKGMTYYEALEYLAGRLHIQYEKRELTAEEREQQYRRTQIMDVNKLASEWFIRCLESSPGAKDYIRKRGWSDGIVSQFCIGYAPEKGGLLKYMEGKGWKPDVLLAAGLVKRNENDGSLYDAFRNRVMFPVYGSSGYIAGFSGRYIGEKEGPPKYLNTGETDLYVKSRLLYGWFQAQRQAHVTGTAVLVEGNPDVLRLHEIGVDTAVAPCGTSLTQEQIDILTRRVKTVIMIGDTDAAGVAAVEKNGEQLLRAGLAVRVMSLPEGKDADEYFRMHSREYSECLARNTEDYVPWMCERKMSAVTSQTQAAAVITDVSRLLALCRDQNTADMYLDSFIKKYRNGKIWTAEYYRAKNAEERKQVKDEKVEDMLREYGFYIKDNCYYGAGARSNDRRWSNFIMKPILHIRDEKNARRIFQIVNVKRQEAVIKLQQSEIVSFADFKTRTRSAGNFVWEAGPNELTALEKYLYNDTPSADEIKQLGWQKKWRFYAWGNGGLDDGTFEKADQFGIINIRGQKFYLPGCSLDTRDNTSGYQQQRKFIYAVTNDISLYDYASRLVTVFGDNAKVSLCFLIATLFKDIVTGVTTSFPILNLFGPKGTGKSELGHSLTSFFIPNNIAPNINNTTKAALAEAVAEVSNAIVHLDEYKNNLDLEKREFLKGLWDGAGRSRMNMDNDKKRETTAVDCGVVMSGQEMPTADIALFNRLVFLTFSKSEFSDEEKRNYEELKLIEKRGLTHLTGELLKLRNVFQGHFRTAWDGTIADMTAELRSYGVEDRTLRNWATVLAAFRCIEPDVRLPFTYSDMLKIVCRGCIDQNNKTKQNNELSGFWETVDILVSSGKVWNKVDYHIKQGQRMVKIRESPNPTELNPSRRYLFLNYSRVAQLYAREGRESGGKVIPRETLKYYLEHSPEFMGTAKSVRFRMIESPSGYMPSNPDTGQSKVTTAMIFDYEAIVESYGIDINVSSGYRDDDDPVPAASEPAPPGIFDGLEEGGNG